MTAFTGVFKLSTQTHVREHLLPSFKKVATSSEGWAAGLKRKDWRRMPDGRKVKDRVYNAISDWIASSLGSALTDRCPPRATSGKCMCLSSVKCRARSWIVGERYIMVLLGKNARGGNVFEYAHRLVAWANGGYKLAKDGKTMKRVAMHTGYKRRTAAGEEGPRTMRRSCRSYKCINHMHLAWGKQKENVRAYHKAMKRGFA
jgi:hypothetical protein